MIIVEFPGLDFFKSYTLNKISTHFVETDSTIARLIANNNFSPYYAYLNSPDNTVQNFEQYMNEYYPDLTVDLNTAFLLTQSTPYIYFDTKNSLYTKVFNDIVPSLQEKYIDKFFSQSCIQYSNCIGVFPLEENFFIHYNEITQEPLIYSDYFKDIKKIISQLQDENKFYKKNFLTIQKEVEQMRKENSDLIQQLQIKSMASWY